MVRVKNLDPRQNPFSFSHPPSIEDLDPDQQKRLKPVYDRYDKLETPAKFAEWASDGAWQPYEYLEALSDEVVEGLEQDTWDILIVEVPVRHGKSQLLSQYLPPWFLCRYPDLTVGLGGYEADFAAGWGRKSREVINEHGAHFDLRVADDSRAANRWNLVNHKGGMWTAGVGGPITGKGGHLLVLDDPIKNAEQARSQIHRDNLWDWWQTTFLTRREPGGKVIVIMSRWHQDDLVGRLLAQNESQPKGLRLKRFRLPALAEDDDPIGREPGEALCPERYTVEDLEAIRIGVGSYGFAALYQQNPMPAEGALFRPEKLKFYASQSATDNESGKSTVIYLLGEGDERRTFTADECWRFSTVDLALTLRKESDWSVVETWDVTPDHDMILVDVLRLKAEAPDHMSLLAQTEAIHDPSYYAIESVTFGLAFVQAAVRSGYPVIECKTDKDKVSRARMAVARCEAGRVWLPRNAPWLSEFVRELTEFPNGRHDDQVDAFSYAAIEVTRGRARPAPSRRDENMSWSEKVWKLTAARMDKKKRRHNDTLGRW